MLRPTGPALGWVFWPGGARATVAASSTLRGVERSETGIDDVCVLRSRKYPDYQTTRRGVGVISWMVLSVSIELPPEAWTPAVCREVLDNVLQARDVAQTVRDDLALAVTEACTNAVRHASTGGVYRMEIRLDERRCVIDVCDDGPGFDPDKLDHPSPDGQGGRGLLVIRAVVDHVRFRQRRPGTRLTMIKNVLSQLDEEIFPELR